MTPSEFASEITRLTGLTFKQSHSGSNSYYCNERRIRISDHYSKYTTRASEVWGDNEALDFVSNHRKFNSSDIDYAMKLINKQYFFNSLKPGIKISHVRPDLVGDIEYISHSFQEETVEVLKKVENKIVKYFFGKIEILK